VSRTAFFNIHGSAVLFEGVGVLLRGCPGSGKSMLALRLVEAGGRLIADDRVLVWPRAGRLIACPPSPIAGLVELRGAGIVRRPFEPAAVIRLVVDLVPAEDLERVPADEDRSVAFEGVRLDRRAVPEAGTAGACQQAMLLVRQAVADIRGPACHRPLHLPPVSP
jgi:serine kinase of HPr protein (carbohydrate metabolism regulator)